MVLTLSQALILAGACAPAVAPQTLLSVAKAESGLDPLAIGVNGRPRLTVKAATPAQAARTAADLIATGRNIDLGLAQINSNNLDWLGLSVEAAFDPCRNLTAAGQLLQAGYQRSRPRTIGEQPALRQALSYYNTGGKSRGLTNGYVQRVQAAAAQVVPAIALEPASPAPTPPAPQSQSQSQSQAPTLPAAPAASPAPPAWDVFGQAARNQGFVIRVSTPNPGESQ